MDKQDIIRQTEIYVREKLAGESTGHDWWHVDRVRNTAKHIAKDENADIFVVELAALLHDIADSKFHGGDHDIGPKVAGEWLASQEVSEDVTKHVVECIRSCSFSSDHEAKNLEAQALQDADRLDAMGAVGIGRAFATGARLYERELYNPEQPKETQETTIGHFYEKLLLLKDRMNTKTGKQIAIARHKYLEEFLEEFYAEWSGER